MVLLVAIFYFFSAVPGFSIAVAPEQEWKKVKENEYMTVWTRKKEGSEFKDIRINAQIPCAMEDLVDALIDVESHTLWVFKASKSEVVRRIGDGELIYHVEIDMPFPVVDRDAVLSLKKIEKRDGREVDIVTRGVQNELPEQEKFVRITDYYSHYSLKTAPHGLVSLEYNLSLDPEGKLPSWVINLAAVKGPVKTMESLYALMTSTSP